MSPRVRLILAAVAFLGWLGYLGYAAATKSRAPIVSHSQAAAAECAVVAELAEGPAPDDTDRKVSATRVTVTEKLWGDGPAGPAEVVNLPGARGFVRPGPYLLYLERVHGAWSVVRPPRSPEDRNRDTSAAPLIYPWGDDVRKQADKLRR
jgi:hypothetical protein